jgi:hypothetical protein
MLLPSSYGELEMATLQRGKAMSAVLPHTEVLTLPVWGRRAAGGQTADGGRRGAIIRCMLVLGACAMVAVSIVLVGYAGVRACRVPLDISGTTELPARVNTVKQRDDIAYSTHVAVAQVLARANCAPTAVGLQWSKAGAHARTPAEVVLVAHGLSVARSRGDRSGVFDFVLCGYVDDDTVRSELRNGMRAAGIRCD